MLGYKILHGGDLNENDNFKMWKLIIHGYKHLHGAILMRMIILTTEVEKLVKHG